MSDSLQHTDKFAHDNSTTEAAALVEPDRVVATKAQIIKWGSFAVSSSARIAAVTNALLHPSLPNAAVAVAVVVATGIGEDYVEPTDISE